MKWIFFRAQHKLGHDGPEGSWWCEAHGEVVAGCIELPAGTYTLGAASYRDTNDGMDSDGNLYLHAEGPYYIPIYGPGTVDGSVGIHGGGSAAPQPLAAHQGWYATEECIRVQNDDLYHLAQNVSAGDTLVVE